MMTHLKPFSIGAKQKIEGNINEHLSNSNFKNKLLNFLYMEYQDPFYAALIGDKEFFCSANSCCMKFYCVDQELKCIKEPSLFGEHLKVGTQVMFHAKHANVEGTKNIVARGNDTNILIILLTNVQHLKNSKLWYDSGLNHDNCRDYIDVKALQDKIPHFKAITVTYSFPGNNYTPSFFSKGKEKPLKIILKNEKFANAFSIFGNGDFSVETISLIEEFLC